MRDVSADTGFPSTDINNIGIGPRHGEAADRRHILLVEDGSPGHGAICRLPDTSACSAEIIGGRISRNARSCQGTAAAEGTDRAVFHALEGGVFVAFGGGRIVDGCYRLCSRLSGSLGFIFLG